jgi:hypothetical protein
LLSFRGISTPSLPAQGEQRRSSYFNIPGGNSGIVYSPRMKGASSLKGKALSPEERRKAIIKAYRKA